MVLAPYLWLIAFFFVPFLIVLKISLSQTAIAQPPYLPVLDLAAGWQGIKDFVGGLSLAKTTRRSPPTTSICFPICAASPWRRCRR